MKTYIRQRHWLLVLLVIVAVFRPPIAAPREGIDLVCQLTGVVVLGIFILVKINRWLGLFLLYTLTLSYAGLLVKAPINPVSVNAFQAVMIFMLWVVGTFYFCKDLVALYDCMVVICCLHVIWAIGQWCGVDPLWLPKTGYGTPIVGLMTNPNELSSLIAITVPAFFRRTRLWLLPVPLVGLVLADSTLGLVASLGAALLFILVVKPRLWKVILGLVTLGTLGFLIFIDTPQIGARLEIIASALRAWWYGSPILGAGPGTWKLHAFKHLGGAQGRSWPMQTHCEYVQGLYEFGLPFLVCLVGLCWSLVKRYSRDRVIIYCALLAVAIESGGHFLFQISTTAVLSLVWLGVALSGRQNAANKVVFEGMRRARGILVKVFSRN